MLIVINPSSRQDL